MLIWVELDTVPTGKPDGYTYDEVVANDAVLGVNVILVAADAVVANEADNGINVILVAADAVVLNDEVLGINVMDVAADAVVANEELITFCVHELVPNNEPVWVPINEPVNEPVFICDELDTTPLGNVAFTAYDDVIANEAVLGIKVILVAADELTA